MQSGLVNTLCSMNIEKDGRLHNATNYYTVFVINCASELHAFQ